MYHVHVLGKTAYNFDFASPGSAFSLSLSGPSLSVFYLSYLCFHDATRRSILPLFWAR